MSLKTSHSYKKGWELLPSTWWWTQLWRCEKIHSFTHTEIICSSNKYLLSTCLKTKKYHPNLPHKSSYFWHCVHLYSEKAMAPHSSTLAWKIPWMEEPSRLRSIGSLRVRHDWATSLSLFTFTHWRRKWQPTPVFLPGESQGRGSLVGCRLWGCTESDTTEAI